MFLHMEFRTGNVQAYFEQLRVFKEALGCLPAWITKVCLCSDTPGYQHNLLKYGATLADHRFGVIEFAIGCDVSPCGVKRSPPPQARTAQISNKKTWTFARQHAWSRYRLLIQHNQ
jgi:hypothetical protein